nr:hypothetical protein BaRGS_025669 [Batillaria attramentaria]
MRDKDGNPLPNAHLQGLFSRICKLLFYRIRPVFVFDGGAPALKKQTLDNLQNLDEVDFDSPEFEALPPEIKHEILTEMKEQRKERALARFVVMPEESEDFSSFQLKKLIKQSKLSGKIESLRKEMNERASGDITYALGDDYYGEVVEARRVVSEDASHYILIKGLTRKQQMAEAEKCKAERIFGEFLSEDMKQTDKTEPTQKGKSSRKRVKFEDEQQGTEGEDSIGYDIGNDVNSDTDVGGGQKTATDLWSSDDEETMTRRRTRGKALLKKNKSGADGENLAAKNRKGKFRPRSKKVDGKARHDDTISDNDSEVQIVKEDAVVRESLLSQKQAVGVKSIDVEESDETLAETDEPRTDSERDASMLHPGEEGKARFQKKVDSLVDLYSMQRELVSERRTLTTERGRQARLGKSITEQINLEAQELLQLFGIPFVVSPMEAESQCAYLELAGLTQGTITDDSDAWLFGAQNIYKNFFNQTKYVEFYTANAVQQRFGFPSGQVVDAYLHPAVDESEETFTWGSPDVDLLRQYAKDKFGWTRQKADDTLLPMMKEWTKSMAQGRIHSYFQPENFLRPKPVQSKRLQRALDKFQGNNTSSGSESESESESESASGSEPELPTMGLPNPGEGIIAKANKILGGSAA